MIVIGRLVILLWVTKEATKRRLKSIRLLEIVGMVNFL